MTAIALHVGLAPYLPNLPLRQLGSYEVSPNEYV